jgi:hypothetical protein
MKFNLDSSEIKKQKDETPSSGVTKPREVKVNSMNMDSSEIKKQKDETPSSGVTKPREVKVNSNDSGT